MIIAQVKHPAPSRTWQLSTVAPMVLRLKAWESRSSPNLTKNQYSIFDYHTLGRYEFSSWRFFVSIPPEILMCGAGRGVCCAAARDSPPLKPATLRAASQPHPPETCPSQLMLWTTTKQTSPPYLALNKINQTPNPPLQTTQPQTKQTKLARDGAAR